MKWFIADKGQAYEGVFGVKRVGGIEGAKTKHSLMRSG
jgi:hypothetical protein